MKRGVWGARGERSGGGEGHARVGSSGRQAGMRCVEPCKKSVLDKTVRAQRGNAGRASRPRRVVW